MSAKYVVIAAVVAVAGTATMAQADTPKHAIHHVRHHQGAPAQQPENAAPAPAAWLLPQGWPQTH
jgi:hypothetical protein